MTGCADVDELKRLAASFESSSNHLQAQRCYRKILQLQPDDEDILSRLAVSLVRLGHLDEAIQCFERALGQMKSPPASLVNAYGEALAERGDVNIALAVLKEAVRLEPLSPHLHRSLAVLHKRQGETDKASLCYRKAEEVGEAVEPKVKSVSADEAESRMCEAEAQFELGHKEDALLICEEVLNRTRNAPVSWYRTYAEYLHHTGRSEEAVDVLRRAILREPTLPILHLSLGILFEHRGDYAAAAVEYERGLRIAPRDRQYKTRLLNALFRLGDLPAMRRYFEEYIRDDESGSWQLPQYIDSLIALGELEEAESLLDAAAFSRSERAKQYLQLGRALRGRGENAHAFAVFKTLISLNPEMSPQWYYEIGETATAAGQIAKHENWPELIPDALLQDFSFCGEVWRILNEPWRNKQKTRKHLEALSLPPEIKQSVVELYFAKTGKLNIFRPQKKHERALSSLGISLCNLIAERDLHFCGRERHERKIPHLLDVNGREQEHLIRRQVSAWFSCQSLAIEEAGMRAICPFSGEMLFSNRSLFTEKVVFYRFESTEVFYVAMLPGQIEKRFLFFPASDSVVILSKNFPWWPFDPTDILRLKTLLVVHSKEVLAYLERKDPPLTAVVVGAREAPRYHPWNDLSALEALEDLDLLEEIDRFWINTVEYFGHLETIFPAIPLDRLKRISWKEAFSEALRENWFLASLGHCYLTEALAERLRAAAEHRCPHTVLAQMASARRHFPLLWINVRRHNREWTSQVDGLVNIVTELARDYPDLGLVFDGHGTYLEKNGRPCRSYEDFISNERRITDQVVKRLPSTIGVYKGVGSLMQEGLLWAYTVDCYLSVWGGGTLMPQFIARKPGVTYGAPERLTTDYASAYWGSLFRENGVRTRLISPQPPPADWTRVCSEDFSLDWHILYEELRSLVRDLNSCRVGATLSSERRER